MLLFILMFDKKLPNFLVAKFQTVGLIFIVLLVKSGYKCACTFNLLKQVKKTNKMFIKINWLVKLLFISREFFIGTLSMNEYMVHTYNSVSSMFTYPCSILILCKFSKKHPSPYNTFNPRNKAGNPCIYTRGSGSSTHFTK